MTDFQLEEDLIKQNYLHVCGIDEVGRGSLFGPVVAGAVILNPNKLHPEINDSKKLSAKKRVELADFIYTHALAYSIGWSWNDEIDAQNILQATCLAMKRAVSFLQIRPDYILMDGIEPSFLPFSGARVVRGDQKSMTIASASIIAKVFRDHLLIKFHDFFPQYDFFGNKGYPTKTHKNMILLHGMTIYHRGSFKIRWPEKTD